MSSAETEAKQPQTVEEGNIDSTEQGKSSRKDFLRCARTSQLTCSMLPTFYLLLASLHHRFIHYFAILSLIRQSKILPAQQSMSPF